MLMHIGGLFIPPARETVEMVHDFERDFVGDGSNFTKAFGLQTTPYREGIATTVAWLQSQFQPQPATLSESQESSD